MKKNESPKQLVFVLARDFKLTNQSVLSDKILELKEHSEVIFDGTNTVSYDPNSLKFLYYLKYEAEKIGVKVIIQNINVPINKQANKREFKYTRTAI